MRVLGGKEVKTRLRGRQLLHHTSWGFWGDKQVETRQGRQPLRHTLWGFLGEKRLRLDYEGGNFFITHREGFGGDKQAETRLQGRQPLRHTSWGFCGIKRLRLDYEGGNFFVTHCEGFWGGKRLEMPQLQVHINTYKHKLCTETWSAIEHSLQ